jgi:hypothetical protein
MEWTDPPVMDVLLQICIPYSGGGPPCRLRVDKLPDSRYRATAASLFEAHDLELCRTADLEQVLRHAHRLGVCRSFREVLAAMQQLSELDDGRRGGGRGSRSARPTCARIHNRQQRGAVVGAMSRRWPVIRRPVSRPLQWL